MAEAGLPGFEIDTWLGIAAPAATPPAVLGVLNRSLATVTADPAVRESLAQQGVQPAHDSSGEFRAILEREVRKWADVVRAADIHPD
jgi:tripartite-type tricarboxylate transporter receptor subunit TctC